MVIYKKDLIIAASVTVVILVGVLAYLFFKTNTFKRVGKLSVAATPDVSGLTVFIDGEDKGIIERWQSKKYGMFTLELPVGQYEVQLKMQSKGYAITSAKRTVNVGEAQTYVELPIQYRLEKRSKSLMRIAQRGVSSVKRPKDFTLKEDGTVIDKRTQLQWMVCSIGQTWSKQTCADQPTKMTWAEAKQTAEGFTYAGYSDWRLPTIFELQTLVYCSSHKDNGYDRRGNFSGCDNNYADDRDSQSDWKYQSPTIVQSVFPNTGGSHPYPGYWSASPHFYKINSVYFMSGVSTRYSPSQSYLVRLVRTVPLVK